MLEYTSLVALLEIQFAIKLLKLRIAINIIEKIYQKAIIDEELHRNIEESYLKIKNLKSILGEL